MSKERRESVPEEGNKAQDEMGEQLKEMAKKVESQPPNEESIEDRENQESEIRIYAIDFTQTKEDSITEQGFGSSRKLQEPIKSTRYYWEGNLHQGGNSSNSRDNIAGLAENFSYHYMSHRNPKLESAGKADYKLDFSPSEEIIQKIGASSFSAGEGLARPLTEDEQEQFMSAFREKNQEISEKK